MSSPSLAIADEKVPSPKRNHMTDPLVQAPILNVKSCVEMVSAS